MLPKILPLSIILCYVIDCQSQKNHPDQFRIGLEVGFPIATPSDNLGLLFNLEPQLKVSNNLFMGLRFAAAINTQGFKNHNTSQFIIDGYDHGFLSILPTINRYWQKEDVRPYLGCGIGVSSIINVVDVYTTNPINPSQSVFEVGVGYQLGLLLRMGIEMKKLRIGLEYNFVPPNTLKTADGAKIGTVNSSYFGITLGRVFSY